MVRKSNRSNKQHYNVMNRNRVNRFRAKKRILKSATADYIQQNLNFQVPMSINTSDESRNQSQYTDTTFGFISGFENDKNINGLLREWVNCHGITTRGVNDLLNILIRSG